MRWELIDGAKHPNPQAVYRWLNSKIRAIHFPRSRWMDLCKHNHRYIDTFWDTVECPRLLFAGGSVPAKGTGSNLQRPVAISPRSLTALVQTCHGHIYIYIYVCVCMCIYIYIQGSTARKAAQAEPAILPQLVTSIINHTTSNMIKPKNMEVLYHIL